MSIHFFLWGGKIAKSFIDVVQDSPRTGLGIPVKTKKKPSFEPIQRPWKRLSGLDFADHVNSSSDTLRHHPHSLTPTCRTARLRWLRYLDKPDYVSFYTSLSGAVVIIPVSANDAEFCSLLRRIMVARWNGVAYAIQVQDSRGYQIHRINLHMDIFTYERGVILWNWNSFPQAQVKLRESKIFRSPCVI